MKIGINHILVLVILSIGGYYIYMQLKKKGPTIGDPNLDPVDQNNISQYQKEFEEKVKNDPTVKNVEEKRLDNYIESASPNNVGARAISLLSQLNSYAVNKDKRMTQLTSADVHNILPVQEHTIFAYLLGPEANAIATKIYNEWNSNPRVINEKNINAAARAAELGIGAGTAFLADLSNKMVVEGHIQQETADIVLKALTAWYQNDINILNQ